MEMGQKLSAILTNYPMVMDANGYPTEETLKKIEDWDYQNNGFIALADFVLSLWHFPDWATYRPETKNEFGEQYRELRLATAGWSGNEDIISALNRNKLFNAICWESSHRGGLHIYHIKTLK